MIQSPQTLTHGSFYECHFPSIKDVNSKNNLFKKTKRREKKHKNIIPSLAGKEKKNPKLLLFFFLFNSQIIVIIIIILFSIGLETCNVFVMRHLGKMTQ